MIYHLVGNKNHLYYVLSCVLAGPYLVVATQKKEVGAINGHVIWEIMGTDLIPFVRRATHLTPAQVRMCILQRLLPNMILLMHVYTTDEIVISWV